jgi:hypothetical protein
MPDWICENIRSGMTRYLRDVIARAARASRD